MRAPDWTSKCGNSSIHVGDVITCLRKLASASVHCVVTSPPYWGLRDYGVDGQIGLERTPEEYTEKMVAVFREVRRVLRDDGTLWLNLGDSYASNGGAGLQGKNGQRADRMFTAEGIPPKTGGLLKPKDLIGIPWRIAFALQTDGWWLRQDIIWHKPNPMPESVRDRCTKAHEYVFLLSKSARYYYDADAISEPVSPNTHARMSQNVMSQEGSHRANGGAKTNGPMRAVLRGSARKLSESGSGIKSNDSFEAACALPVSNRNRRSVWIVPTQPYKGAHFATYPEKLVEPCIRAGCPVDGVVLDPFMGSGTTLAVSLRHSRKGIGIELNGEYAELAKARISRECDKYALFAGIGL